MDFIDLLFCLNCFTFYLMPKSELCEMWKCKLIFIFLAFSFLNMWSVNLYIFFWAADLRIFEFEAMYDNLTLCNASILSLSLVVWFSDNIEVNGLELGEFGRVHGLLTWGSPNGILFFLILFLFVATKL